MAEHFIISVETPEAILRLPRMLTNFRTKHLNKRLSHANLEQGQFFLKTVRFQSVRPPGPRRVTGQYVASWELLEAVERGQKIITIVNPSPQWRRLEYGYMGVDSLGRRYNQAPRPHIRIAKEATLRRSRVVYGKAVQEAWMEGLKDL